MGGGGGREEGVYWEQGTVCGQGTYRMQGANIVNRGGGGGGGGGCVVGMQGAKRESGMRVWGQ